MRTTLIAQHDAQTWLQRFVTIALGLFVLLALTRATLIVPLKVSLDPNEGWNAYHALAVLSGHPLYPCASSIMVNNYPPLSFYLVAAVSRITGDPIIAGRILSLIGITGIAAGIAAVLRIVHCGWWESICAALFFIAALFLFSDYIGMDDPQLFAQAIQVGALALVLSRGVSNRKAAIAGVLFALMFFFKHNLFVLPLAVALWLALFDLRRAILMTASGVITAVIGLVAFRYAYGVSLFSIVATPREFSWPLLFQNLSDWLAWAALPLAALIFLCLTQRSDRFVVFCALYSALSIVTGALLLGGAGVDVNAMFDADIALALAFGLSLTRVSKTLWRMVAIVTAFFVPLIFGTAEAAEDDLSIFKFWAFPLQDEARLTHGDIAFLASRRGPALCETLALCYWAGKPAEVDVFNTAQYYLLHARSDAPLARKIAARYFGVLQFETLTPFLLTPAIHAAISRYYRVDHTNDDGVFFVPR